MSLKLSFELLVYRLQLDKSKVVWPMELFVRVVLRPVGAFAYHTISKLVAATGMHQEYLTIGQLKRPGFGHSPDMAVV